MTDDSLGGGLYSRIHRTHAPDLKKMFPLFEQIGHWSMIEIAFQWRYGHDFPKGILYYNLT